MTLLVLAPFQSKKLFEQRAIQNVKPIFYRIFEEPLFHKVIRKVGWYDDARVLRRRLQIDDEKEALSMVYALWLSPSPYIPPPQMVCLLNLLPSLKWVYFHGAGTDHLDLDVFREHSVMVSNSGMISSRRVAEMALANILAHAKHLPTHFSLQRKRLWRSIACEDVRGQTVGIVGTGHIGKEVANLCRAIGMRVIGATRDPKKFGLDPAPYHEIVQLNGGVEKLLAQSDHVVLTLPLNQQTRGLIGLKVLKSMKRTASLINVARVPIVNEAELCHALRKGLIGGAYIDPTTKSHYSRWSPLNYKTPNLVITHYSAANNLNTLQEAFDQFVSGLNDLIRTGHPPNRVA